MAQSAWKDYSSNGHQMNYAYETFDPKSGVKPPPPPSSQPPSSRPRQPPPANASAAAYPEARNYSLPRGGGSSSGYASAPYAYYGGSYDRRSVASASAAVPGGPGGGFSPRPYASPPDHYFMPSQRKYSGENIRVYVDYNK